jgi:hypothetical protein
VRQLVGANLAFDHAGIDSPQVSAGYHEPMIRSASVAAMEGDEVTWDGGPRDLPGDSGEARAIGGAARGAWVTGRRPDDDRGAVTKLESAHNVHTIAEPPARTNGPHHAPRDITCDGRYRTRRNPVCGTKSHLHGQRAQIEPILAWWANSSTLSSTLIAFGIAGPGLADA